MPLFACKSRSQKARQQDDSCVVGSDGDTHSLSFLYKANQAMMPKAAGESACGAKARRYLFITFFASPTTCSTVNPNCL